MNNKAKNSVWHFIGSKFLVCVFFIVLLVGTTLSGTVSAQTGSANYPQLERTHCEELDDYYDSLTLLDVYFLLFHYFNLLSHDYCDFDAPSGPVVPPVGPGLGDAPPEFFIGGGEVVFYHNDHLGSPIAASDDFGELLWEEEYQPYGEKINAVDYPSTVGYTGHQHDEGTGLTYMQARYYDPVVGRFMGVDPVGFVEGNPVSFNRFAYGNNNPYKFVDPDGRQATLLWCFGGPLGCAAGVGTAALTGWAVSQAGNVTGGGIDPSTGSPNYSKLTKVNEGGKVSSSPPPGNDNDPNNDKNRNRNGLELPATVRSPKGVQGRLSDSRYSYRIDTNKVARGEGGFHIHVYRGGNEVAKLNGRGGYVVSHKGSKLLKPSQLSKGVRNDLNTLVRHVQKKL